MSPQGVTRGLPLWAVVAMVAGYATPGVLAPAKPAIFPLLGLVMLGMGLTLTPASFSGVLRRPGLIALGLGLQFGVMPAGAWVVGQALGLPPALLAGLVLMGSCPGGTASNVLCYLGRGDLALSVTLTAVSTLAAVFLTPGLTWLYAGRLVPVPVADMLITIAAVVLLPVAAGVTANTLAGERLAAVKEALPLLSVAAIALIIAIVVALNHTTLASIGPVLLAAVALHNGFGLAAGYGVALGLGLGSRVARTLSLEVGMQNSGLGVALAAQFFPAPAALPGVVFSVWHNLSGAALAALWSRNEHAGTATGSLRHRP